MKRGWFDSRTFRVHGGSGGRGDKFNVKGRVH